ncbi:WD repeat-containing mip1 [Lecanosticta acicola]|uniref:WD repeat-containing mip1 n=1 Tax=Lecanosticta acicola TaxID=111012 RepID=A0AAI8YPP3_9PEZI|nr:WD repeat-containing mip1 [Lecanosticta acicola]
MTRAATAGLLPEEVVNGHRSKHAQPVLDDMQQQSRHAKSQSFSANTLYRPSTSGSTRSQPNGHYREDGSDSEEEGLQLYTANGNANRPGRPALSRAKSEHEHGRYQQHARSEKTDPDLLNMRHGWESQLQNEEVTKNLSENFFMYYEDKRHETAGNLPVDFDPKQLVTEWRMKDRLKTVSALLAVCLNVGVDPPDVIKTNPCARMECWVDPVPPDSTNQNSNNTNAQIGKNLQSQYENLSLRSRYKVVLDPTIEELKKYTQSLRRTAHQERILFHYNGHGVPKPTASGEVWCFNRSYTQYIPISLMDLQEWVGAPGLWVWDCSAASSIITGFLEAAQKHALNQQEALKRDPNRTQQQPLVKWEDCIHLAACKQHEVLPTNPDLPADLFTSCLTTPIMMAVRFFILQNPLTSTNGVTLAQARHIPGKVSERRTPLGELNWIFTAITDTIAWNCLDKPLFKKLFRQDLMVAALFRNFLLAQRVMRMYHCHPQSHPLIPDTHDHPLWKSWDLAVEMILAQLPKLIEQQKANEAALEQMPSGPQAPQQPQQTPELDYQHSDFFADQLSAFEVYLTSAPCDPAMPGYARPPEQLPIVLQVLLSQVHRLRALVLLSKFLDLGPWAVNLALSIGIFPYVLKLLQSQAMELKAPMIFIWARILAVDQTCQTDLLKDAGFSYFTNILVANSGIPTGNIAEHRAMCTFIIAVFCKDFKQGKSAVLENTPELIDHCLENLMDMQNPLLRQFSLLCLSNLCRDYPPAREAFVQQGAHNRIADRTHDPVPEVRTAVLHTLASFIATHDMDSRDGMEIEHQLMGVVCSMGMDGSIMVRRELTVLYSEFVNKYENRFICAAWDQLVEEQSKKLGKSDVTDDTISEKRPESKEGESMNGSTMSNNVRSVHQRSLSPVSQKGPISAFSPPAVKKDYSMGTIYRTIWRQLMSLSADPHPEVARNAGIVVDYILNALLESPLGSHAEALLEHTQAQALAVDTASITGDGLTRQRTREARPDTPPSPVPSTASKPDGYFALSRTASVAQAMKSFIGWGPKPPGEVPSTPTSPTHGRRGSAYSTHNMPYRSRPLTPADAAQLPPDLGDNIPGPPHQPPAKVPPTPHYRERDLSVLPMIPLKSNFFDWSASYFREPQMRPSEADEPGSKDYNERLWRRNRNDKIIASTQPLKEAAGTQRWDKPCGYFGIGAAPVKMVFHQFENHLITSDDRDSIAVWDWQEEKQLNRFSNGNPKGSRVTDVKFINEDDIAMLMTGSSDGVMKIFRNYEDPKQIQHVSSFRALNDLIPSDRQSSGLVFDWQQGQGRTLVAGDDRVVRVWQVGQELCVSDIQTRSSACITSLTSDQVEGNVFVAGFGNGSVKVFDQRLPRSDQMHMSWHEHKSWVVGVHLQRGGMRELISAESNGGIRLWDIRMRASVDQYNPSSSRTPRSLRTLSVHEHAPVFATGGKDHVIRVYSTTNVSRKKPISSFEPYMSYMRALNTPRMAPITATAFHPHRMMLACGAVNDGHVNLFKCDVQEGVGEKHGGVVDDWPGHKTMTEWK